MKVGMRIRKLRELRNFTQEFVAEQVGISQAAYSDIEKDKTEVSLTRLSQIAKVLDVSTTDIIAFDEKVVFNIQENKSIAKVFYDSTAQNIEKIEQNNTLLVAEIRSQYESRLQDKNHEIARLQALLEQILSK